MNRLTRITAPDGSAAKFAYDYRGRRTSVTDANGSTTQYSYDDAGHLIAITDMAGHITSYQYNTENHCCPRTLRAAVEKCVGRRICRRSRCLLPVQVWGVTREAVQEPARPS